jgi:hypothetical protein
MKPDWSTIDVSKLQDDFESWRQGLAYPVQKALDRLRSMNGGEITIADNMKATIYTFKDAQALVHGVEMPFKCPSFRPIGFTPFSSVDAGGNNALPVLGLPQINYNRTDKRDGWYGMTVNYAPETNSTGYIGETFGPISRVVSSALPLTTNVPANVIASPLTLTPGAWKVTAQGVFVPTVTTSITKMQLAVSRTPATLPATDTTGVPTNGECLNRISIAASVPTNDNTIAISAYRVDVAAGATLPLYLVAQGQFTVSTLGVGGSLEASRLKPYLTGYSANVTGVLWGG